MYVVQHTSVHTQDNLPTIATEDCKKSVCLLLRKICMSPVIIKSHRL